MIMRSVIDMHMLLHRMTLSFSKGKREDSEGKSCLINNVEGKVIFVIQQ